MDKICVNTKRSPLETTVVWSRAAYNSGVNLRASLSLSPSRRAHADLFLPYRLPSRLVALDFNASLFLAFSVPRKVSIESFAGDRLRGHAGERLLGRLLRELRYPPPRHGEVSQAAPCGSLQEDAAFRAVVFSRATGCEMLVTG